MFDRQILEADIIRTNRAVQARPSRIIDFTVGAFRPVRGSIPAGRPAFPCVVDLARARTLYVPGLDPQKLRDAPFSYLYAKRQAKSVLLVPWEAGPINRPRVDIDPLYFFSSGRCGSTLLHNILIAAKIHSVSEPDVGGVFFSPIYQKYRLVRPLLRWVTQVYERDLVSALGSNTRGLVVKLRSQFCAVAQAMLERSRESRTIFMIRRFETWAQSVAQIVHATPDFLLREYHRALTCYAYLRRRGQCHLVCYEDLVARPHETVAMLAEFLGRDIPTDATDRAMSIGSQSGTGLDRVSPKGRAQWEAIRDKTYHQWKSSLTAEIYDQIIGNRRA
jgi:hypothetical protein